jgi:hypothetical protein
MWRALREALILGVILLAGPTITIDKNYAWDTHEPTTLWPVLVGVALIVVSAVAFFLEG